MIIEKKLLFEGSLGEQNFLALFDSGATYSCIRPEKAKLIGNVEPILHPFQIETASEGHYVKVNSAIRLDFYIENYHFSDEFMVIPNLSEEVIIGAKTMQSWRMTLDFEHDKVVFDPRVTKLRLL